MAQVPQDQDYLPDQELASGLKSEMLFDLAT